MPIYKGTLKTGAAYKGSTSLSRIYKGAYLVFEAFKTLIAEGVPPLTLLNCVAEIMLGYRVYGNSIQDGTPTPDTPIEIECVGDKTKNLWNSTLRVGCMKFADGQYLNYPGYVCNTTPIPVEAGETYTISANNYNDPDQTSSGFVFYNNGSFVSSLITTSLTVTIPSGVNQLYYNFRKQSDPSYLDPSDITNVQLEKGSSATTYEPYGYRIPIKKASSNLFPYPYILESGRYGNIDITINDDGSIKLNGTTTGLNTTVNTFRLKAGTYTISGNPSPDVNLWLRVVGSMSSADYVRNNNGIKGTLTIAKDSDMYVYITVSKGVTLDNVTIYPMVNEGAMDLEYSKYFAPETTNIYLDEPLRKIDTYSDYIDFETQKVYRNVASSSITKDTSIAKFGGVTSYSCFYLAFNKLPDYTTEFKNYILLSPTFVYHEAGGGNLNQYWTSNYQLSSAVAEGYKRVMFTLPTTITDTTAAKTWLESNPINFFYPSHNTVETSITIPSVLLNKGTNVVGVETSITPSNLWIKYKGRE